MPRVRRNKCNTIAFYGIQDRGALPLPGYTHDHAVCQMIDGEVVGYLQLERYTRRKYDNQLHLHLDEMLAQSYFYKPESAAWVSVNSFVGAGFISGSGSIRIDARQEHRLHTRLRNVKGWLQQDLWSGTALNAFSLSHELAHISANLPFYGPFPENTLLIHFDGGASLSNCSVWLFRSGKLQLLDYHWDLVHLSKLFNNNALAFGILNHLPGEHCAVPGKLMGFASIGTVRPELMDWLRRHSFFVEDWGARQAFQDAALHDFGWTGVVGDTQDTFLQDLAACMQEHFVGEWLAFLSDVQARVRADALWLSGGCALNIVANTRIVNSGLFQQVRIPPCPGDSGLALGAAAFHQWSRKAVLSPASPYLNNLGLTSEPQAVSSEWIRTVGDFIASGKVVGLYHGAGEVGPRALGHRSILARPDSVALAQHVSMHCKRREWYRPIAPVMREVQALRLTALTQIHPLSRYMLLDFQIPKAMQSEIAGVVHANGTARIQTLFNRDDHPLLWDLLEYLEIVHHIPALINTSFNAQGEPMVHTTEQARAAGKAMHLDLVSVNGYLEFFPIPD